MDEPILVINAGSSSIKFLLFETTADGSLAAGPHRQVSGIGTAPRIEVADEGRKLIDQATVVADHQGAIAAIQYWFAAHIGTEAGFTCVGHRVVHGGMAYSEPVLDAVIVALEALVPLAPLHQPHQIAAIRAIRATAPNVPQIACFDTAFYRTQPPLAQQFALPREMTGRACGATAFTACPTNTLSRPCRKSHPAVLGAGSSSPISAMAPARARSRMAAALPRQ